jgi:hypothetical protein
MPNSWIVDDRWQIIEEEGQLEAVKVGGEPS